MNDFLSTDELKAFLAASAESAELAAQMLDYFSAAIDTQKVIEQIREASRG